MNTLLQTAKHYFPVNSHLLEVIQKGGMALLLMGIGVCSGLVFNLTLARSLGATGAGIYYLAFDTIMIGSTLSLLGLNRTALRNIATYAALDEWSTLKGKQKQTFRIVLGTSCLIAVILYVVSPFIASTIFSEPLLLSPLRYFTPAIVLTAVLFLQAESLRGLKKIRQAMILQIVGVPIVGLPLLFVLSFSWGIIGATLARALATFFLLLVGWYWWHNITSQYPQPPIIKGKWYFLVRDSLPFLAVDLMNLLMRKFDTIFLGVHHSSSDVGIYNMALRIAILVSYILVAANSILAPKFAALHAKSESATLSKLARQSTYILAFIACIIGTVLLLTAPQIMTVFGEEFVEGASTLRLLIVAQAINVIAGPVDFLLLMSGHEKIVRNNVLVSSLTSLFLNAILVPTYGIIGAATAALISLSLRNMLSTWFVQRKLNIQIWL